MKRHGRPACAQRLQRAVWPHSASIRVLPKALGEWDGRASITNAFFRQYCARAWRELVPFRKTREPTERDGITGGWRACTCTANRALQFTVNAADCKDLLSGRDAAGICYIAGKTMPSYSVRRPDGSICIITGGEHVVLDFCVYGRCTSAELVATPRRIAQRAVAYRAEKSRGDQPVPLFFCALSAPRPTQTPAALAAGFSAAAPRRAERRVCNAARREGTATGRPRRSGRTAPS